MGLSLLSWNIAGSPLLDEVLAEPVDVALLQEVPRPSSEQERIHPQLHQGPWRTAGWKQRPWRTAIVAVSDRAELHPIPTVELCGLERSHLAVSRPGTLTAADVFVDGARVATVVSWYATWEHPPNDDRLLGADAAAHRLLSDVSALIDHDHRRPLIAAGDLNLLYGYAEYGSPYWAGRYQTVFRRAEAIGLHMVGPQLPHGRQADPWPAELPTDSLNVPTYHTNQQEPSGATRQLDFVFASTPLAEQTSVTALNGIYEWGPSDHCRIRIELSDR